MRVEAGSLQFGDDWPGTFVRGDDGMAILLAIASIERKIKESGIQLCPITEQPYIDWIKSLLGDSITVGEEFSEENVQKVKPWEECQIKKNDAIEGDIPPKDSL